MHRQSLMTDAGRQFLFISFILMLLSNGSFSFAEVKRGSSSVSPGRNSTIRHQKSLFGYEHQTGKQRSASKDTRKSRKGRNQSSNGQKRIVVRFDLNKLNKNFNDCLNGGVTDPSTGSPRVNDSLGIEMQNLFESREKLLSKVEVPPIGVGDNISAEVFQKINTLATLAIDGTSQNQNRNFCMFSKEAAGLQVGSNINDIRNAVFDSGASGERGQGIGQITGISRESYSNYVANPEGFEVNNFSCEILVSNVVYLKKIGLIRVTKSTDGYVVQPMSQNTKDDLYLNLLNGLHNPIVGLTYHKIAIQEAKDLLPKALRKAKALLKAKPLPKGNALLKAIALMKANAKNAKQNWTPDDELCIYKDGPGVYNDGLGIYIDVPGVLEKKPSCVTAGYVKVVNACVATLNSKDPKQIASSAPEKIASIAPDQIDPTPPEQIASIDK